MENERYVDFGTPAERKSAYRYNEQPDAWPFMSQGDLQEELDRFVCALTSQTMRRWQKLCVISSPSRYNTGARSNIASYKLYVCAECYAAAVLSLGNAPRGEGTIPANMMPKLSLPTIAYLRCRAFGLGKKPLLPCRDRIENKIGYTLPGMPDIRTLNLKCDPDIQKAAKGCYAKYYAGCLALWEDFFVDGMVKFFGSGRLQKI